MYLNFIFRLWLLKFRFHFHLSSSILIQYWTSVSQCYSTVFLAWWYHGYWTQDCDKSVIIFKPMVQGLPHGWHVWRKNLSFQPSFSDFNSRNLFSFSSIFLNNHPITDDRMLSVTTFDKFGGLSSWKFFLDISTTLNEVLIPFFSSGECIVCVVIFHLCVLGCVC